MITQGSGQYSEIREASERPVMDRIECFEDLIAWQKARQWSKAIYAVTRRPEFARDFGLRDQIRKAVVSVMAKTAEGFERDRLTEFHQFVSIAKASCAEVRSHLYVAFDECYIDSMTFEALMNQGRELGRILGGLRASLERKLAAKRR
jgi:four helix bundle protein